MERIERNGVVYYAFSHIEKTGLAGHGFSTRLGGVSEGVYTSMNLSHSRNDNPARVRENIRRITNAMGIAPRDTVFCAQVHENRVVHATAKHRNGGDSYPVEMQAVDGLIANTNDVALVTMHADCVPLFFLDPVRKAVGMTHAGWRGTMKDIAGETVRRMQATFGSGARDLLVGIGPSIGRCCFEVGTEVTTELMQTMPFAEGCIQAGKGKPHVDLQGLNEALLLRAGVCQANIEVAGLCTKCRADLFYSHRRDGAARGSMAAFIQLR